ncbi:MAG: hypothetical protein U0175_29640 [Caldilineaceae bacterium]
MYDLFRTSDWHGCSIQPMTSPAPSGKVASLHCLLHANQQRRAKRWRA